MQASSSSVNGVGACVCRLIAPFHGKYSYCAQIGTGGSWQKA